VCVLMIVAKYRDSISCTCRQQLALIVNGSREIVRPGAFWFVQDPHEREVNPIRDILERSSWLQLKKLGSSAEIYGFTVILAAVTIKLIMWVVPGLAPFTWTTR
jgi:E3 ubiquitin-protein ligase MARCH6